MIVRKLTSLVAVLMLLFATLSGPSAAQQATPSPSTLTDLHDLKDLQEAFNAQRGEPRLLLLLSPT
jgi:hypothetical protein